MVKLKHSRGLPDFRYLLLDGSNANTNIDIGTYNFTANAFYGDGTTLTGIAVLPLDHGADLINVTANQHHNEVHTIVSHDTTATGAELDTLTDNSIADALHRHSELVASDGAPDPAVSVDGDGIVSMPHQSGCRVWMSDAQTIPTGIRTKMQFKTEVWDIQGEFDNVTNYRFTAKKAGYYLVIVSGHIADLNDGDITDVFIYKNGALDSRGYYEIQGGAGDSVGATTNIVYLAVGNFIEGYIRHDFGADRTAPVGPLDNYMSIQKLA